MSEVEVLLSVDRGFVPKDTLVFLPRDPEEKIRRSRAALSVMVGVAGLACAFAGAGREIVALFVLSSAMLALYATPTSAEPEENVDKPPTLVITRTGMIMRDASGLRTWRFEELKDVRPFVYQQRVGLLLVQRDGTRDFIDPQAFKRGDHLGELIGKRLQLASADR